MTAAESTALAERTDQPSVEHTGAALPESDDVFNMVPRTLGEAKELAQIIASSDLVPKDYKNKPANVMIAVQYGREIGLQPLQAVQGIAVINGRPSVWGDHALAIVSAHPVCAGVIEHPPTSENDMTATCVARRKGRPDVTRTFSMADAERAGLWGKQGPWQQYPQRMLQMRARGFAIRDQFADVMKGLSVVEEQNDIVVDVAAPAAAALTHDSAPPATRTEQVKDKLRGAREKVDQETGEITDAADDGVDPAALDKQVRELHEMLVGCKSEDDLRAAQAEASDLKPVLSEEQIQSLSDQVKATAKRLGVDL